MDPGKSKHRGKCLQWDLCAQQHCSKKGSSSRRTASLFTGASFCLGAQTFNTIIICIQTTLLWQRNLLKARKGDSPPLKWVFANDFSWLAYFQRGTVQPAENSTLIFHQNHVESCTVNLSERLTSPNWQLFRKQQKHPLRHRIVCLIDEQKCNIYIQGLNFLTWKPQFAGVHLLNPL